MGFGGMGKKFLNAFKLYQRLPLFRGTQKGAKIRKLGKIVPLTYPQIPYLLPTSI